MAVSGDARRPGRFVLPQFLSWQECEELEFIHRTCGVFGYRPFVLSTTLSHLVATDCAHLIIPILAVRERVKEAVEEYFSREYELFVEFTGLISWTKGASISWHSDDNRSYLRQRHYSAVCYLNTYERDFKGGLFHFQEGEPSTIIPSQGTLVIYTADARNMHQVDEVTEGERCTLALWFTSDSLHDEDHKLIQQISIAVPDLQAYPLDDPDKALSMSPPKQNTRHAKAASSVMYKAYNLQNEAAQLMDASTLEELANPYFNTTIDLRLVRLALMGLTCCFSSPAVDDQHDNPVKLTYKLHEVPYMFSSSLEALQVAGFHQLKTAKVKNWPSDSSGQLLTDQGKSTTSCADALQRQIEEGNSTRKLHENLLNQNVVSMEYLGDPKNISSCPLSVDKEAVDDFLDSVQKFEAYRFNLWKKLFQFFPSWRTTGSLFSTDS